MTVQVDAKEAIAAIRKLREEDLPAFSKELMQQLGLEGRKIMVQKTTQDHNQITGRLRGSIDIFDIPEGVEVGPSVHYAQWVYQGWEHFKGTKTHEKTFEELKNRAPVITKAMADKFLGAS